ncbi:HAD family hydrolase [Geojedonia litorea]|uniref:HAD family hydrolase n=1 Tax=Geojedonia litorea TaxID=1268269 RepID=A0ABV9N3I9_9FLAO
MSYKTKSKVIFDLDHTLYNYDLAHKIAINEALSFLRKMTGCSEEKILMTFNSARKNTHIELANTASSHNRLLYFQKTLEGLNRNALELALPCYETYWGTFLNNMILFKGVISLLEMLKSQGREICILTDLTTHIQMRKINALELTNYVDFMVSSEEAGKEKPHSIMFYKALDKLKGTKEQAVMIGDNWEKDILGAYSFGIQGIWLNHKREKKEMPPGITEIFHFEELLNIL